MANYYVSVARGDDSAGTGTALNPWKTIGKAIGSSPAITLSGTGDTVWIEPGLYPELVTIGLSPVAGGTLSIKGDCDGAGFLAGGYTTPVVGDVEWNGWTNDFTPTTSAQLLAATACSYVDVEGIVFVSGEGSGSYGCVHLMGAYSDWTFRNCIFIGGTVRNTALTFEATAGAALNLTMDSCDFYGVVSTVNYYSVRINAPLNTTEYSLNCLFANCYFEGTSGAIFLNKNGGTGTAWSTGITIQQCIFRSTNRGLVISETTALTTPIGVYGCEFLFCTTALSNATAGQVVSDGNYYKCQGVGSNVTPGAHDVTSYRFSRGFNRERLYGGLPRPFLEPTKASPLIGAGGYGTPPANDSYGLPRPDAGAAAASVGCVERHFTGAVDTGDADSGSAGAWKLIGRRSAQRLLLVSPSTVNLTIKVRWDGNHGDANKPQVVLVANPEIGVAAQTVTASSTGGSGSTLNSYETLTFSAFTPTRKGVLLLRMFSRAAASNGVAVFDSIEG